MTTNSRPPERKQIQKLIAAVSILVASALACAQDPMLWGSLKPGRYHAGFRTEVRFDLSRQYDVDYAGDPLNPPVRKPRPILIAVWYPTEKSGPAMPFRQYIERPINPQAKSFQQRLAKYMPEVVALDMFAKKSAELTKEESAAVEHFMEARTYAIDGAPPAPGKFPVIIDHPGLGGGYEDNATLYEFLASNGYIVISSAFQMAESTRMSTDWDLDRSLHDLDFLANAAANTPQADTTKIAVMGHSFGGQAALAWAASPFNSVAALVTLDSGLEAVPLTFPGISKLYTLMEANRKNVRCPVLRIVKQSDEPNFSYLDPYLKFAPSYESTVGSLRHNDFLTHGAVRYALLPAKATGPNTRASYDRICTHVLAFLDLSLKGSRSRMEEGLDKGFTLRFRPAAPSPPTARQLAASIRRDGVNRAVNLIRQCKDDIELGGDGIGGACTILAEENNLPQALTLIQGCAKIYPDSMVIFSIQGGLLLQAGEKAKAIESYQHAKDCVRFQKVDDETKARWTKEIEARIKAAGI